MVYRCWTVYCKTDGCGVCLTLDVIGPDQKFRQTLLPPLMPFTVTCGDCKTAHEYTASDVEERNIENPSLAYKSREFLEAIAKGTQAHRGTAGFNDGDGSAVAGVFWHNGGFILDRDGRMRYLEPEQPGWYYWFEGIDSYRYLHGPYDSQAEAESELEISLI